MAGIPSARITQAIGLGNTLSTPQYSEIRTNPGDDDVAVGDTVRQMSALSLQSARHPVVIEALEEALLGLSPRQLQDQLVCARNIYYYVKRRVQFLNDDSILTGNAELLFAPEVLLSMPYPRGDCDDFSMCIASLYTLAGIERWFVTIAADPFKPNDYSHIYLACRIRGTRYAVDGSHGPYFGWEAPAHTYTKRREWSF